MKKELETILIIIVVLLMIAVGFLFYQNSQPKRVYFEEITPNLLGENCFEKICPNLCDEKSYDGYRGSGSQKNNFCFCDCYKLVR